MTEIFIMRFLQFETLTISGSQNTATMAILAIEEGTKLFPTKCNQI